MPKREPFDYQVGAVDHIKEREASGLFIDMGMGKTGATLLALLDLPGPVLLVGPIRVIENVWQKEAKKWEETKDVTFSLIRGSKTARKRAVEREADIYLVNPELLEEALLARSYGTLVVDESSMFKNSSTKRFKKLRKHLKKFERRIILTGTPMPNGLADLWSQIFILDLGERLDTSFYRFRNRFFRQADYMGYKFEPVEGAVEKVTELISDLIYRVERTEAPCEVRHNPVELELPPAARKVYDEMAKEAFVTLADEDCTAATAAAVLMKLRQVASGFLYDDSHGSHQVHSEKIEATKEIVAETGGPVIVVYNFQHELAALKKAFPQGVDMNDFNQDAWDRREAPILFLHPQSGGHGLNLQEGSSTMVIFSASFSYEQMSQTMARIDRTGQTELVIFHHLIAKGTVDELLMEVLEAKETRQSNVLDMVKKYAQAHRS